MRVSCHIAELLYVQFMAIRIDLKIASYLMLCTPKSRVIVPVSWEHCQQPSARKERKKLTCTFCYRNHISRPITAITFNTDQPKNLQKTPFITPTIQGIRFHKDTSTYTRLKLFKIIHTVINCYCLYSKPLIVWLLI